MTDIRTVRTKEKIRKAFIQLLEEEPYEKINVTEIATLAEINRVTYYTHYCDKEELVKDIVDVFATSVTKNAKKSLMVVKYDDDQLTNFVIAALVSFVDLAIENRELLSNLSKTENMVIFTFFEKSVLNEFNRLLTISVPKRLIPKYSFSYDFIVAGFNKVIFDWVLTQRLPKDDFVLELKKLVRELTSNSVLFTHD